MHVVLDCLLYGGNTGMKSTKIKSIFLHSNQFIMEVAKTYLVRESKGFTELYHLKDGRWILNTIVPTGNCWANNPLEITATQALLLLKNETKIAKYKGK
jgi:hypothetical protein